jgi:glycosyltransferase involved in cell wall biosynthesis
MHVTQFVNSFVNRPGNIGVRTGYILKYLEDEATCVCRGVQDRQIDVEYREMGLLGHVPRILNGIRILMAPKFDHRKWDVAIFEWFSQRQFEKIKTDVAHVWDICPKLMRQLKKAGIPVVLDIPIAPSFYGEELYRQGRADFLRGSPYIQSLELEAITEADLIVAPSMFVAGVLNEMGVEESRITIVEFGVNAPLQTIEKDYSKEHNKSSVDFCLVGNINRRKGVPELLSAWSDSAFKEDRLHLCGRINADVHSYLSKAKGSGNVLTPGFINPFDYMRKCDVFVLPSWLEGSAKVVYEAMACGLPAIVTHSTGSVVRDGIDGFVIEAGDVEALKERMIWFKQNPSQIVTMGENAKEHVQEYTWKRYSDRLGHLYHTLCV